MHTNQTQYYQLPQYVGTDIINPLVDTNGAYSAIDTALHDIATAESGTSSDVSALEATMGSGTLETTAQTVIGAVNEIHEEINTQDTGLKDRVTTAENDIDTLETQMATANGNIVNLQNNKADNSTVTTIANDVSGLKTTVGNASTGLVKDVSDLETTVGDSNSGLVKAVNDMSENINNKSYLTGRKFIIMGDSYAIQSVNWIDKLVQYLGIASGKYLKIASGGLSFTGAATGATFTAQFNATVTQIDNEVTDVIVCSGVNERGSSYSDITTAISDFRSAVLAKCPKATIHIGMISWTTSHDYVGYMANAYKAYKEACLNMPNMHYLNGSEMAMHRYDLFTDTLHPTATGGEFIARTVKDALISGFASVPFNMESYDNATIIASSQFDLAVTGSVDTWMDDNNVYLKFCRFNITPADGVTYTNGSWYKLFDLPAKGFVKGGNDYYPYHGFIGLFNNSDLVFCDLATYNGGLYCRWIGVANETVFASLVIEGTELSFPLLYEE